MTFSLKDVEQFFQDVKDLLSGKSSKTESKDSKSKNIEFSGFQIPIKSDYHNSGGFDPTGTGSVGRVHQGVDLRAPGGTSIYPIAPGEVIFVRTDPKGGNTVNVKHDNNYTSYYAHMGTISVHVGDKVGYDTALGTVGASGNAKGFPHLHLQVWKNGQLIDPASILKIPPYTPFNTKKEKLWLPDAKKVSDSWNINKHLSKQK